MMDCNPWLLPESITGTLHLSISLRRAVDTKRKIVPKKPEAGQQAERDIRQAARVVCFAVLALGALQPWQQRGTGRTRLRLPAIGVLATSLLGARRRRRRPGGKREGSACRSCGQRGQACARRGSVQSEGGPRPGDLPRGLGAEEGILPGLRERCLDLVGRQTTQPGVLEGLEGRRSALRVHAEQPADEALALLGERLEGPREVHGARLVLPRDLVVIAAVHHLGGHQCVQHAAHGPDVGLRVVARALKHLWGNVLDGAAHLGELLARLHARSEPEVDKLDGLPVLLVEHDVLRLEVAMHHAARMQVRHGAQDLRRDARGAGLVQAPGSHHAVEELAAPKLLGYQVNLLLRLVHGLEPHELRVLHGGVHVDLPREVRPLLLREPAHLEALDREGLARAPADALDNLARGAAAEHLARQLEVILEPREAALGALQRGHGGRPRDRRGRRRS
mmetsp:Transcript_154109/g.493992  ORF Transcript_154109/g.493992 Transcript_154109/m.493992 type:complete len:450 (+) Transcript_154109:179-1528(+)